MSLRARPGRLFVYGTLCDPDLFEIVAGAPMKRFHPLPARARHVRALLSAKEPMPVIRRGGGITRGLLLSRITAHAWRRIDFYEDEFRLARIDILVGTGKRISAQAYWPKRGTAASFRAWNFRGWQRQSKARALAAAKQFMEYVNAPPGTDLFEVWRGIKAKAAAPADR